VFTPEYLSAAARDALAGGRAEEALRWLALQSEGTRPAEMEAAAHYALAKRDANAGRWGDAEQHLKVAAQRGTDPLYQKRLGLTRSRQRRILDDKTWELLLSKIDPATRLPPEFLSPDVSAVYAAGAYHAWTNSQMPWSRLLRISKQGGEATEEHAAATALTTAYLSRYVLEHTPLLHDIDVVVPIPARATRFSERGYSLPDELVRALTSDLGLPASPRALVSLNDDVELRGLTRAERRVAIKGTFGSGDEPLVRDRCVLLVDDVMTSGATFAEAAIVLRAGGVAEVKALCLCHTES
jgi:predicted amidophosphoribosyltransferase